MSKYQPLTQNSGRDDKEAAHSEIVSVVSLTGLDKLLGYRVPKELKDKIKVGCLVRVPLLRRNELAVVRQFGLREAFPISKLKYIYEIVQPYPVITPDLLQLAEWMQSYYLSTAESIVEAMVPAAVRRGMGGKHRILIRVSKKIPPKEIAAIRKKAPRQADLYEFLRGQFKPLPRQMVLKRLGLSAASLKALVKKGLVEEFQERFERLAYDDPLGHAEIVPGKDFKLNPDQEAAINSIVESLHAGKYRTHLLHGVTGSGKTEVYIHSMKRALQMGGSVIYLVPEVALTPQTVGRLRSRFEAEGVKTVVWHSHLSDGERLDAWHSLASGEAHVVVGARSAVFAPVQNLRLVVVDEEHEPAYKQDESPRYHGRDVAVYRASLCRAVCVLGSATPSLESLYNTKAGKYVRNTLPQRVDDKRLPHIHIVDMKREIRKGRGPALFSRHLIEKMADRFDRKEQTILFINRRGYSTSILCPNCGYVAACPHCSITLTYHRFDETLRCHLCATEEKPPRYCPSCRSDQIQWRGYGTQRIEEIVKKFLPRARVVRMDTDAMSKKNLFRKIFSDFRAGKIDVLVGTQMIAKGLDFPNVTLVGLVDADMALRIPDFRAAERSFQLMVQVSGRAGRGDREGEVVVQTFLPHSPAIQFAKQGDFDGFLAEELAHRKEYHYPPFRHLIHHRFRGLNPEKVFFFAEHWTRHLEANLTGNIEIRGPAPAPLEKIRDQYRFQIWYFVTNVTKAAAELSHLRQQFKMDKDVIDTFDVDPVNLV